MSLERKWDKIRRRDWDNVRDAWIAHIPIFPSLGAAPDPGLEQLAPLLAADIPEIGDLPDRVADVDGMRRNVLWEASRSARNAQLVHV
jgi:hypothetical protein